ncbi:MAG: hypothetical protein PUD72_04210 [Oscillospiraceae bacterium]|nr:hypothetical protein [Oscillospiraceae bacterium]
MESFKNNYPTVFIHGFLGWGEFDGVNKKVPYYGFFRGNLMEILRSEGYEVYAPSLGPTQSAWDRCCELYAVLFGGTVDYGKVHSLKYGHKRYGRTYEKGILSDLGQTEAHKKMNIVGHSFGGPTVMLFQHLMANGCQEEVECTPANELSPLFVGGKGNLIHTVTTLSGVNNGTTFASALKNIGVVIIDDLVLWAFTALGNKDGVTNFIDFHMDQWGVMDDPHSGRKSELRSPFAKLPEIRRYNGNPLLDSIGHEMQIEAMAEMNKFIKDSPNIYYFARRANRAHPVPGKKSYKMDADTTFVSKIAGAVTCRWKSKVLGNVPEYHYDAMEWLPNDGLVNVPGLSAPFNKPSEEWTENTVIRPGIWYNMPIEHKDHMSWLGVGEDKDTFIKYNKDMLDSFRKLADG